MVMSKHGTLSQLRSDVQTKPLSKCPTELPSTPRSVERDGEMKKQAPHQVKAVGIPERSCGNDPVRQSGA